MRKLVYDLPTRLFHWLFAFLFLMAFFIGKTIDHESTTFIYHMLAGLSLGFIVFLRLIWGFAGTKHSKFSGFDLNIKNLFAYLQGILKNSKKKWAGHNPASSWAGIIMILLTIALVTTGILMTSGDRDAFEDIHEIFANTFIIVVIMHIAGILLHTVRHKEMIGLSMIDGKKEQVSEQDTINSANYQVGILFVALFIAFNFYIKNHLNLENKTLKLFGTTLQLGEAED